MGVYSGTVGFIHNSEDVNSVEVEEWSIDLGNNIPDVTAFGVGWGRHIVGIRNYSVSFSLKSSDQALVETFKKRLRDNTNYSLFSFKFYVNYPTDYFKGTALLSGSNEYTSFDGTKQVSFTLTGVDLCTSFDSAVQTSYPFTV